jgi:hypothetical protein
LFLPIIGIKVRCVNFLFNPGTPIFASVVNRLVEARLAIGKGRLGFTVEPLYKHTLGTKYRMLISQVMLIPSGI